MRYRNLILIGSWCCLLSTGALQRSGLSSLRAEQDAEPVRVVKIYPVADLCGRDVQFADPGVQAPGTGLLDPPAAPAGMGGIGGGMGLLGGSGEGGAGMGGMGGGGMFAIPAAPPQMGGMGMGVGGLNWSSPASFNGTDVYPLIELLQSIIARDDFVAEGLHAYQGQLVARQTEACHAEIAALLAQLRRFSPRRGDPDPMGRIDIGCGSRSATATEQ
jgi:hypothetical protein